MTIQIITQLIGAISLITAVVAYFQKEKHKVMLWLVFTNLINISVYLLLGRLLGSVLVLVATLRTLVYFYFSYKQIKMPVWVLAVFQAALISLSIYLWKDATDIIMLANLTMLTYTTWQDNMLVLKSSYIISGILLIFYDFLVGSYVTMISRFIKFVSATLSVYALIKERKQSKHQNQASTETQSNL